MNDRMKSGARINSSTDCGAGPVVFAAGFAQKQSF